MAGRYRKLSHRLYSGSLGRKMREGAVPTPQALAPYLIGCEHGNMVGLYRLPVAYIAADLGWPLEGALKALRRLSEWGFIRVDEGAERVWIVDAFRHEFAKDRKSDKDNNAQAIAAILEEAGNSFLVKDFLEMYGAEYPNLLCLCEAPSKGLAKGSEGASARVPDQEQDPEQDQEDPPNPPAGGFAPKGRKAGRKIPKVKIPEELRAIGIDSGAFAERVRTCVKTKPAGAWQKELDRLAPLVEEVGEEAVLETWEDAVSSGWQGCTPAFVRQRAGNGRLRERKRPANPPLSEVSYNPGDYGAPVIDIPARLQSLASYLPETLAAFRPRIEALSGNGDAAATEAELEKLDRALLKAAAEGLDAETRKELANQVDAAMKRLDGRLDEKNRPKIKRQFKARALRERIGLPELSLFGKEAQP